MTIVGFNFNKIYAERKDVTKGNVNIRNNINIKSIEKADVPFSGDKQGVLRFVFEFTANYEPKTGDILLTGSILYMDEQKRCKEILDNWKKDKKIEKEVMSQILNNILSRCNVQALILSQEINIPPPMPLPKLQINEQIDNNYIG